MRTFGQWFQPCESYGLVSLVLVTGDHGPNGSHRLATCIFWNSAFSYFCGEDAMLAVGQTDLIHVGNFLKEAEPLLWEVL